LTLENGYKIKFTESPSKDVVGYRLYRSVNGGPFTTRASQNVLSGSDPVAFDYASQDQLYAYYLVAVDVVGNESEPSEIVYSREPSAGTDILFPAPGQTSEQSGEDSGDGIVDENGGENGDNSSEERDRSEPPFAPGSSAPSVPQGVQAEPLDDGSGVKLTWQANPRRESIVRYDIYYSNERNGVYQKIGSSNTTQFTYVSGSSAGWYRVVAVNNNGSSDPSEAVQP
jgi:penicillin-binding protein